ELPGTALQQQRPLVMADDARARRRVIVEELAQGDTQCGGHLPQRAEAGAAHAALQLTEEAGAHAGLLTQLGEGQPSELADLADARAELSSIGSRIPGVSTHHLV